MIINFSDKIKRASIAADSLKNSAKNSSMEKAEREAETTAKMLSQIIQSLDENAAQSISEETLQAFEALAAYGRYIALIKTIAKSDGEYMILEDLLHGYNRRAEALIKKLQ